jgi:hypothetical protein
MSCGHSARRRASFRFEVWAILERDWRGEGISRQKLGRKINLRHISSVVERADEL